MLAPYPLTSMGPLSDCQFLEDLMSCSPDVLCAVDFGGLLERMSTACRLTLGFEPADLLGQPFAELLHPDDRAAVVAQLGQAAAGEPIRFHCRCLNQAGQPVPMAWLVSRAPDSSVLLCFGRPLPSARAGRRPTAALGRATAAYRAHASGRTESAQRFRLLFENTLSLSAFQDVQGRTLDINAAFLGFLRQPKQQVLQQPLTDFLVLEFRALFIEKFAEALSGRTVHYDATAHDAAGQVLTLRVTKTPLLVNGRVVGIHVAALDTTAFSAAQEELAHLAEQHLTILESITGAFLSFDTHCHLIYLNREAEQLFGLDRAAHVGQHISQVFPEVLAGVYRAKCDEALASGRVTQFETYASHLGRWLDVKLFPLPTGMLVYILDITDLIESARQVKLLALVAEGTDNGVVIAGADGGIEWVNAGFTKHTGYALAELVGHKVGHVLQGPETDPEAVELFRAGLHQAAPFSVTLLNYTKAGEKLWLVVDVTPIHNQAGELTQYIALLQNINFRKETEARQGQMTQDLYTHNRDLQQFTYMISHDLRAPLANALGLATLLTKLGKDTDSFDQTLSHLRQSMSQADAVLTDLNQVLAIRDQHVVPEPVDLAAVCTQALASLAPALAQCDGQVRLAIATGLTVRGTRAYLYSIFDNLLSNALKYRAAERPLEVTIQAVTDGNGGITISVTDNGLGFDTQQAGAKLFQLYQRFHSSPPGRGIGLFLVKIHVEAMGGHIDVTSIVGVGTHFLLSLPGAEDGHIPPQ
ncbi:MAG: PAS domain-containing sensor histidine kinase [Janthinobacterium lividum]